MTPTIPRYLRYPSAYNKCPVCGSPKKRESKKCSSCRDWNPGLVRPHIEQPPGYRLIALTKNQVTSVDVEDYDWLMQWKWQAWWNKGMHSFYAVRKISKTKDSPGRSIYMHREILQLHRGDKREADHIQSGQTLDNRRSNLRIVTSTQNKWNMRGHNIRSCPYKGVTWDASRGKYMAQIFHNGKQKFLGRFHSADTASVAYDEAAKELFGEYANTNLVTRPGGSK